MQHGFRYHSLIPGLICTKLTITQTKPQLFMIFLLHWIYNLGSVFQIISLQNKIYCTLIYWQLCLTSKCLRQKLSVIINYLLDSWHKMCFNGFLSRTPHYLSLRKSLHIINKNRLLTYCEVYTIDYKHYWMRFLWYPE